MRVINTEKKPIKMWLENIEDGALEQAKNLANLPFVYKRVSIMPDSHQGFGMPIGGVLATKGVVIPNAVGVDIGCGMCAIKTDITNINQATLKTIMQDIRDIVPLGFEHQKENQEYPGLNCLFEGTVIQKEYNSSLKQLGTLGGGNHFIEIQKDEEGFVWIMIHSGSRNLGKQVADYYNKLAISLNTKWYSLVPKEQELAFLPIDSQEGQDYIKEMEYCVEFALANRKLMMDRIVDIFTVQTKCRFEPMINIAHNYARLENHFGENVMVHRKGATSVRLGEIGIVPGSQGTCSYIVEGLGNKESFESCSHGAGRKMSRTKAQAELNLQNEIDLMDKQGIIHGIRNTSDLDEASGAYKDIDVVMDNQKDLVKIIHKLTPLAVIKG